jgi:predicted transcriptional regulator YheO
LSDLIHLLATPWVTATAMAMLILLVLTFVISMAWALRQGREVVYWPPRIGPRPSAPTPSASPHQRGPISGSRLFQHQGYYPIDLELGTNIPSLNQTIFVKAIHHFLHEVDDRRAAMDLVYLREDNRADHDILLPQHLQAYGELIEKYGLQDFQQNHSAETDRLFRNTKRLVADLGATLRGVNFEILLHDVRNPLRSVIAACNTEGISNRQVGSPSTRFVVQYLRHQGKHLIALNIDNKAAYPKYLYQDKLVKATTTPLFDDQHGLIGLLCFNIDVNAVNGLGEQERQAFFDNYTRTSGEPPEFERDEAPVRT